MSALREDAAIVLELVPDDELVGYTEDEAYALLAGVGPETSTAHLPVVAAANAGHTGAMIALVPSDADLERLAVSGGEPAEDLHLTLLFLGDAADVPDDVRVEIEDVVRYLAREPITAEAFSVNMFNPSSDEKDMAVVLGVGNDGGRTLERLHAAIAYNVGDVDGFDLPEQHAPWVPHVTLAYTDDLQLAASLVDRVGPITFDKLRIAFADQVIDVPLTGKTAT